MAWRGSVNLLPDGLESRGGEDFRSRVMGHDEEEVDVAMARTARRLRFGARPPGDVGGGRGEDGWGLRS